MDILKHTCGNWYRDESAADTVRSIKEALRESQERYNGIDINDAILREGAVIYRSRRPRKLRRCRLDDV